MLGHINIHVSYILKSKLAIEAKSLWSCLKPARKPLCISHLDTLFEQHSSCAFALMVWMYLQQSQALRPSVKTVYYASYLVTTHNNVVYHP